LNDSHWFFRSLCNAKMTSSEVVVVAAADADVVCSAVADIHKHTRRRETEERGKKERGEEYFDVKRETK
jgi:hypothetical protein